MVDEPSGEIVLYQRDDGAPVLEVRLDQDTLWLTQAQIAVLFQTSQQNVSLHLRNIYAEGELDDAATHKDFLLLRREGTREVQNKLHYAAHGHTAAEVIAERADATKPNMGLTSFAGVNLRKSDVGVAKNYLDEGELTRLNTLVSAYFDAAEFRAQNHEPTYMKDWLAHLDRLITAMDAQTLPDAGKVSHAQAVARAEGEYAKYRAWRDATPAEVERAFMDTIKSTQHEIEGKK